MSEAIDTAVVVEYPDMTHSTYPQQEDRQIVFRDPNVNEIPLINQYNALMAQGQTASAVELLRVNPSLMDCIINADKLLALHHSIISVERFFYDNVLEKIFRIGNQKGQWNEFMSSDAEDEAYRLNKYDVVRYPVDGISQYFLVIGNNIEAGDTPLENLDNEKYLQVSMKGDKGDQGYTPIKNVDYFDGQSGLGLTPRGVWVNNLDYFQYDLVSHNGYLWYCTADNIAVEPGVDPMWIKIKISMQSSVGSDIPVNLEEGGIWMHMQDDGHIIIKTKNADGEYVTMFPETQASYVKDATGVSLQRKIYQHYFDRDDVKVTMTDTDPVYTTTATLLTNEAIVVAQSVLTDATDENGTMTEEFTVYDENWCIRYVQMRKHIHH